MRLFVKGQELTELVGRVEWAGDELQVARTCSFTLAKSHSDPYIPRVTVEAGDVVVLQANDGRELFYGIIFTEDKVSSAVTVSYTAYDLLFYVLNSEGSWIIDETPEAFTARVCAEFGVPTGFLQWTDVHVYSPALKKTGYQAIMMAYTEAYRQNNGKYAYIPLMEHDRLTVIPKGMDSEVVLEATGSELTDNMIDAGYKVDATKIVNKVLITDKNGNRLGTVEDTASQQKYGVLQQVVQQQDGKDAHAEANNQLKGLEEAASATALSDPRAVAGWSLLIHEADANLYGRFFIKSDRHVWEGAGDIGTMELTLAFEVTMDEYDLVSKEG